MEHPESTKEPMLADDAPQPLPRPPSGMRSVADRLDGCYTRVGGRCGAAMRRCLPRCSEASSAGDMPLDIVGQHAQQDVRAHPTLQPVMDGPHLQVHRLDRSEGPLDLRQRPVHGRIQIVRIGIGHTEVLGQGAGVPPARGRQLSDEASMMREAIMASTRSRSGQDLPPSTADRPSRCIARATACTWP